jgi:hypothetical protein
MAGNSAEKIFDRWLKSDLKQVYTYIALGGTITLIGKISLPSSFTQTFLGTTIIATAVFSLHEYVKQRVAIGFDIVYWGDSSLSEFPKLHSFSIAFLDFLIGIPMFGSTSYTFTVGGVIFLIFLYYLLIKVFHAGYRDLVGFFKTNSYRNQYIVIWLAALIISVYFNYSNSCLVSGFQPPFPEMLVNHCSNVPGAALFLVLFIPFIVILTILIYPFLLFITFVLIAIVPYSLIFAGGGRFADMSILLRYWATMSLFCTICLALVPKLPSIASRVREWRLYI